MFSILNWIIQELAVIWKNPFVKGKNLKTKVGLIPFVWKISFITEAKSITTSHIEHFV